MRGYKIRQMIRDDIRRWLKTAEDIIYYIIFFCII